jgi:hypothetical protein
MAARGTANQLERLVEPEPVALCDDAFRLLDCDPGVQRMLELGAPLIGRVRDGEQPSNGGGCLLERPDLDLALFQSRQILVPPRLQIDDELAVERIRNPKQRVDPWRTPAAFETGDRGLRRADELRQLPL